MREEGTVVGQVIPAVEPAVVEGRRSSLPVCLEGLTLLQPRVHYVVATAGGAGPVQCSGAVSNFLESSLK